MYSSQIEQLKDFILTNNPYFNNGYANVYVDETTGFVTDGKQSVFPQDTKGNYFYLRVDKTISFGEDSGLRLSDCKRTGMRMNATVNLIAVMKAADTEELIYNLTSTIVSYDKLIIPKEATWQREEMIKSELSKYKEADRLKALRNAKYKIVRVTFTYPIQVMFKKLNCIENPCGC